MTEHENTGPQNGNQTKRANSNDKNDAATDGNAAVTEIERGGSGLESDKKATNEVVGSDPMPAAGPHGAAHLTNEEATPGSGLLAEPGAKSATDSTGG